MHTPSSSGRARGRVSGAEERKRLRGAPGETPEGGRKDAESEDRRAADRESESVGGGQRRSAVGLDGILHVERVDDLQVVADRDDAVDDADERQNVEEPGAGGGPAALLNRGLEDEELADEPGRGRDAGEREEAEREDGRRKGGAAALARQVRDRV